jgi:hypothetical protein
VAGFDAEGYLRQAGVRWLREGGSPFPPWNPVLAVTGAALVAVGAMTIARARAVIDDYEQVLASAESRQRPRVSEQAARSAAPGASGIGRLRVVPSGQVISQPWGRLTIGYVAFTDRATTMQVTVQPAGAPQHPYPPSVPAAADMLAVTDDRGTTGTAKFSGELRYGESAWRGQYEVRPLLAPDTAWIELGGQRIELAGEPAGVRAWAEPLSAQDPARRHLWQRVATVNDFHDLHLALEITIATLTAAGALHDDDPQIGNARAVLATLRPPRAATTGKPASLAQPWQSLLARWREAGGPLGTVTVGAITPPFDGVTAAVIALKSDDEHFRINVELAPGVHNGLPWRNLPDQQYITWWAADDQDNYYLGEHGSWSSGDDRCGGAILFWPALDPRAASIDLMPTATSERAVIRVPLPWSRCRSGATRGRLRR